MVPGAWSGRPRLNSTSFDDELVFNNADLSLNRNNLSHQAQEIISPGLPKGFIESPMWVGSGTRLQARKLSAIVINKHLLILNLRLFVQRLPLGRGILMNNLLLLRGLKLNMMSWRDLFIHSIRTHYTLKWLINFHMISLVL